MEKKEELINIERALTIQLYRSLRDLAAEVYQSGVYLNLPVEMISAAETLKASKIMVERLISEEES